MSQQIKDLKENDSFDLRLLVKSVNKGATNKNVPYASLSLQDKTGTMDAKLWDLKPEQEAILKQGTVLEFTGSVLKYSNALQLRITTITALDEQPNLEDYVLTTTVPIEDLKKQVKEALNGIHNETYKAILMELFKEKGKEFFEYPAASKNHHGFLGGLATHVCGMLKLAEALCAIYPELDHDLLVSGVLVHDYGKMIELSGPITTEYTLEGKLIGHISIMQGILMETADKLGVQDTEEAILLRHMVLSHHGQLEYGSPVLPSIREAEILSYIDNIDARMNCLAQALDGVEPGEWTNRIFAMENRSFYKPKNSK